MSVLSSENCEYISKYTEKAIKDLGYPFEVHQVETEDGYINTIYRIPHSRNIFEKKVNKKVVLLVHGLVSSCAESVHVDYHLGYYLADNGYDVWIANCRGTTYSRGHKKFDHVKNAKEYWNFSFHEIGYYDHPAFIDYILENTGCSKIFYIGISQGSTTFVVMTSSRPEYNNKIQLACLMCPAVKFQTANFLPSKLVFCYAIPFLKWIYDLFRKPLYEIPLTYSVRYFGTKFASNYGKSIWIRCLESVAGHSNPDEPYDELDIRKIAVTTPNTAGFKQFLHFSQVFRTNEFKFFDYGDEENLKRYKTKKPPFYKLTNVIAPVVLFYSKNDAFMGVKDVDDLGKELGNCVGKILVEQEKFNHINFIYSSVVLELVYSRILKLMRIYEE